MYLCSAFPFIFPPIAYRSPHFAPISTRFPHVWRTPFSMVPRRPMHCDVFEVMRWSNSLFGFYHWAPDPYWMCRGPIRGFALDYAAQHNFTAHHLRMIGLIGKYSGAWGVFKWSFFSSTNFVDFVSKVTIAEFPYKWRSHCGQGLRVA